ncbi:MAG TPA: hypothetical protein VLJ61_05050 [Pyrinomonadaceae bacterium]|nr:hypothetical protein [Pyrinomonadaceae bacterium]
MPARPPLTCSGRDEKWSLRFLPGYVACGACEGEKIDGDLSGMVFSYEYTSGGRLMAGRVCYLQADSRTSYTLHFTGARERLQNLRDQMDAVARNQ